MLLYHGCGAGGLMVPGESNLPRPMSDSFTSMHNPATIAAGAYPQFDGGFEGCHAECQLRYNSPIPLSEARQPLHHFEGNQFSKSTDDSSAGGTPGWVTSNTTIRRLDNLGVEHGIGSNDTPQRLTAALLWIFLWERPLDRPRHEPCAGRHRWWLVLELGSYAANRAANSALQQRRIAG
jgi:hypothetical protein